MEFSILEKQQLIDETVTNFNEYINPGFLQYRKSFSPDYVAGKLNLKNSIKVSFISLRILSS